MLDPELIPTYESLYTLVTGLVILIGFVILFVFLVIYIPSGEALSNLSKTNAELRKRLTELSNQASVNALEKNHITSKKDGRIKQAESRAEVFAQFGDKCLQELNKQKEKG